MSFVIRHEREKSAYVAPAKPGDLYHEVAWTEGYAGAHHFRTLETAKMVNARDRVFPERWKIFEVTYGVRWVGPHTDENEDDEIYFVDITGTGPDAVYNWSAKQREAKRFATKAEARAARHPNHRKYARIVRFLRPVTS